MENFNEKKEQFMQILEKYIQEQSNKEELLAFVDKHEDDDDFLKKELFQNIFAEIKEYLDDISTKELKQRLNMLRTY